MSNLGPINRGTHARLADEAQTKADAVQTITAQDVEDKQCLQNLANEHRNIVDHGTPENN